MATAWCVCSTCHCARGVSELCYQPLSLQIRRNSHPQPFMAAAEARLVRLSLPFICAAVAQPTGRPDVVTTKCAVRGTFQHCSQGTRHIQSLVSSNPSSGCGRRRCLTDSRSGSSSSRCNSTQQTEHRKQELPHVKAEWKEAMAAATAADPVFRLLLVGHHMPPAGVGQQLSCGFAYGLDGALAQTVPAGTLLLLLKQDRQVQAQAALFPHGMSLQPASSCNLSSFPLALLLGAPQCTTALCSHAQPIKLCISLAWQQK